MEQQESSGSFDELVLGGSGVRGTQSGPQVVQRTLLLVPQDPHRLGSADQAVVPKKVSIVGVPEKITRSHDRLVFFSAPPILRKEFVGPAPVRRGDGQRRGERINF